IISSVGMRPRTMRIALIRSYGRASPAGCADSVLTAPESTPWIRASISAWSSILSSLIRAPSLHHEAGEVDGFQQLGLAAHAANDLAQGLEGIRTQFLLALVGGDLREVLVGEQRQQVISHHRVVRLQQI